jgi:hypothetical protein
MESDDTLGLVEFAVLESVSRGTLRSRRTAQQIDVLRDQPAGDPILHAFCAAASGAGCCAAAGIARDAGMSGWARPAAG